MAEGKGVLQYRFVVAKNGKNIFVRDYNTTNKITWTPAQAGTYTIYFKAKDESGKEVAKSMDYEVSEKSTANKGAIQNSIGINSSDDTGVTVKLSSAGDTSLYSFNDYFYPINDEWSIYGGNWKVENGKLGVNAGGGYKALIKDKAPFTDFVCEADVNVDNGDSDAGIVFRASNPTVGMDSYLGYYVGVYGKDRGWY